MPPKMPNLATNPAKTANQWIKNTKIVPYTEKDPYKEAERLLDDNIDKARKRDKASSTSNLDKAAMAGAARRLLLPGKVNDKIKQVKKTVKNPGLRRRITHYRFSQDLHL